MKKINYLITAIFLTFIVTVYAKHSFTTTFNSPVKSSHQNDQLPSSVITRLNSHSRLSGAESLFPCIVDSGN